MASWVYWTTHGSFEKIPFWKSTRASSLRQRLNQVDRMTDRHGLTLDSSSRLAGLHGGMFSC
jgi:hypothetical protein